MKRYEIQEYKTKAGKSPFSKWLGGLKDKTAQRKITQRVRRASLGHFGDSKKVQGTKNIFEMREHYGPGYRVFYSVVGDKMILLLAGSNKRDQDKVIEKAKLYLSDYERNSEL